MHAESLAGMEKLLKQFVSTGSILDVGSMDVKNKGNYRSIIPAGCTYTGVDLVAGPNVDVVMRDELFIPFGPEVFDCVITGQTFEHVKFPFSLILECGRVLKRGGIFIGVAPFEWPEHNRPDRWRFLPDGWRALFEWAKLTTVDTYVSKIADHYSDCWGIALKGA